MTWRLGLSTGACTERSILAMLPAIHASGARAVEIGTPPRHFDPMQADQIRAVRRALDDLALGVVSIHAPFGRLLDLADPNPHHRHAAIGAILTAAAALKELGGHLIVVHPSDLERNGLDVWARLHDCAASLKVLAASCRQEGLALALETQIPHLLGGHPDEFRWLLGQIEDSVRVCLDTGHTFLGRSWHTFLNMADGRLAHVHANDNHGRFDDHLGPGEGAIDWSEIARTLRAAEFAGWTMLELHCPNEPPAAYFKRALERTSTLLQ